GRNDLYCTAPISFLNVSLACATRAGSAKKSTTEAASALAPTTAPLCASDVAGATPAAQWCAGMPGILDGKDTRPVGTIHVTSPESFDDALWRYSPSVSTLGWSPITGAPYYFCSSLAIDSDSSLLF